MDELEVLSSGPEPDTSPRLGRTARLAALTAAGALVIALASGYAGYRVGRAGEAEATGGATASPGVRLEAADWFGDTQDPPLRRVVVLLNVTNLGAGDVQVLSAGTSYAGLTLLRVEFVMASGVSRTVPSPPFGLDAGRTVGILLTYRVTDCAAATSGRLPLPVWVLDGVAPRSVDVGRTRAYTGPWQAGFLTSVCPGSS